MSAGKKFSVLQNKARQLFSTSVLINEPLARHTTFRIGGPAELFFKVSDRPGLFKVLRFCREHEIKFFVLGRGSNVLVADRGFGSAIISLAGEFEKIELRGRNRMAAGAAASLSKMCFLAQNSGLAGLEWAWGLPASAGGAVFSNAGAFGAAISRSIKNVTILDSENLKIINIPRSQLKFSYRRSNIKKTWVILQVELKLKKSDKKKIESQMAEYYQLRKLRQPVELASAGSIFKNPVRKFAGQLIEQAGLKGKKIGRAQFSEKHANIIVNLGGARAADVIKLIKLAKEKVARRSGIKLKEEITYLN